MVFMVCRLSYESELSHFLRLLQATMRPHVLSVIQIDQSVVFIYILFYLYVIYLYIYINLYIYYMFNSVEN